MSKAWKAIQKIHIQDSGITTLKKNNRHSDIVVYLLIEKLVWLFYWAAFITPYLRYRTQKEVINVRFIIIQHYFYDHATSVRSLALSLTSW